MPDRVLRYVITGEDRGARKTLEDTATAGEKAAGKIGGAFSKLGGMVGGEFGEALDKLSGAMDALGEHGDSAAKKLTAFGAAGTALGVTLTMMGANEKRATDQLRQAIEDTGQSYSDYSEEIEKAVKHQENFGHRAEDTKAALQKLTQATQDPKKALEEMGVTADLAAAKHISLSDAAQLVARVLGGTGGKVLAQYGIKMQQNADGTKNVDLALQQLGDRLKGQAAAAVNNFSGQMGVVLTKLQDWGAEMGQKFGPAITVASGLVTAAGVAMQVYQSRTAAAAAANAAMAASEGEVAASSGALATIGAAAGPIAVVTAAAVALSFGLTELDKKFDIFTTHGPKALGEDVKSFSQALMTNGGVVDDQVRSLLALSFQNTGLQESFGKAGLGVQDFTKFMTGSDEEARTVFNRWLDGTSAGAGLTNGIWQMRDAYQHQAEAGGKVAESQRKLNDATEDGNKTLTEQDFLLGIVQEKTKNQNLTLADAQKQYQDAYAKAHTFTAELGYMSTALDTLSNNQINARLGQLHLTDAWAVGTGADSELTRQVQEHGSSLKDNTADGRANQEWLISQILAINAQALAQAKATGSIKVGTDSLATNTSSLLNNAVQAGLTRDQVETLIKKYEATPAEVNTSIKQQGADAVEESLGEIADLLHALVDHNWVPKIVMEAGGVTTSSGGFGHPAAASGGLLAGGGTGTSDSLLIRASSGEFVVNAAQTKKWLPTLKAINTPGFAQGGMINPQVLFNFSENADEAGLGGWLNSFAQSAADQYARDHPPAPTGVGGPIPGGGAVSADVQAEQDYAFSLFRYYGWDQSQLSSLISLWNGESGWNPGALNPSSGAYGIPQSLPADKMASAGADWATNPATQIRWGVNYIASVYGSPSAAYGAWLSRSPHWYDQGGWLNPGWNLAYNGTGSPEYLSNRTASKFGGVFIAPGAIQVYAAPGMDEKRVAAEAFALLRRWVDERERRALKGARA